MRRAAMSPVAANPAVQTSSRSAADLVALMHSAGPRLGTPHRVDGNVRPRAAIGQRVGHWHRVGVRHVARKLSRRAARGPERHRAAPRVRHRGLSIDARRRRSARFDPAAWVPPMKLRRLDRTGVYAVAATKLALDDAGASIRAGGRRRHGRGARHVDAPAADRRSSSSTRSFARGRRERPRCCSTAPSGTPPPASPASSIKLRGPNVTVSHKEASGLAAIVSAVDLVREGRATARDHRRRRTPSTKRSSRRTIGSR